MRALNVNKVVASLGIIGPGVAYIFICLSIYLSPSFSWYENALSDLGNSQKSCVAPIFNFGLLASGFLTAAYAFKSLSKYAKYTSVSVAFSALMLQFIAAFDEAYGKIHFIVSVVFFVSAGVSCIVYFLEKKKILAIAAFLVGLMAWLLYWANVYRGGVAIPEIISAISVTSCLIESSLSIVMRGNK
ncbi:MAG: DUF998 domain-containing protein [Candidatus Bathyarchaeia archaeon]